jgi:hypothetical protein
MTKGKYLHRVSDIRAINESGYQELIGHNDFENKDGRLFFNYRFGMNRGLKPVVVDEEGVFWIGKEFLSYNYVHEVYGSNLSRFLDSPSPEIGFSEIDGKPHIISCLVFPCTHAKDDDMKRDGQKTLVPRLMASHPKVYNRHGQGYLYLPDGDVPFNGAEFSIDMNRANFLVDSDGTIHQIDFSRKENVNCIELFLEKEILRKVIETYGLSSSVDNHVISDQIDKLDKHEPSELIEHLTEKVRRSHPDSLECNKKELLWSYRHIIDILSDI